MSGRNLKRRLGGALFAAAWLALLAPGLPARSEEARSLVVVTSRDDGPYEGVVEGIQETLGRLRGDLEVKVQSLQSGGPEAMQALQRARGVRKVPLLTIGSVATRAAFDAAGSAPVISCMSVDGQDIREGDNATGVLLEFPLETQLEWIRKFTPKTQTIGVLYNPAENRERIEQAKKIATRLGFELVARTVHRPQDLPDALDSLAREVDILWAVTDQMVLSRQTAQAILLFSFRNRMPFSGLSGSWVKAGALYALDRDYKDLGAQCAELAVKVLNGRRAGSLPPAKPRKVLYVLNLRTADHLKLSLPRELVDGAAQVYR